MFLPLIFSLVAAPLKALQTTRAFSGIPQFINATPLYHDVDFTFHHGLGPNDSAPGIDMTIPPQTTWVTVTSLTRFYVPDSSATENTVIKGSHKKGFNATLSKDLVTLQVPVLYDDETVDKIQFEVTIDHHPISLNMPNKALTHGDPTVKDQLGSSSLGFYEFKTLGLPKGQHSLRIRYEEVVLPMYQTIDKKTFYYAFGNGPQLNPLQVSFHYDQSVVFDLPTINLRGCQIGTTGAFWKANTFTPNGNNIEFQYYDLPSIH